MSKKYYKIIYKNIFMSIEPKHKNTCRKFKKNIIFYKILFYCELCGICIQHFTTISIHYT